MSLIIANPYGFGIPYINSKRIKEMWYDGEKIYPLETPRVRLSLEKISDTQAKLTGWFEDFENRHRYLDITDHGFVTASRAMVGAETLMVNSTGRQLMHYNKASFKEDGSFIYTAGSNVKFIQNPTREHVLRAYLQCKGMDGRVHDCYSQQLIFTYGDMELEEILEKGPY